jgi:hypothetical protein
MLTLAIAQQTVEEEKYHFIQSRSKKTQEKEEEYPQRSLSICAGFSKSVWEFNGRVVGQVYVNRRHG